MCVLLIGAGLGGSAGAEDGLFPLSVVSPEESGPTHQVKILSPTVSEGIKYPAAADVCVHFADGRIREARGVKAVTTTATLPQ